jgi:hypothetical protein
VTLFDFSRRRLAPFPLLTNLPASATPVLFNQAVKKAKEPEKPQGNPEQEKDGRIDHDIRKGETLTGIAPLYQQKIPDILLTNPEIHNPDLINEGGSLRILSEERRTSLETIKNLNAEAKAATDPATKEEKNNALKTAINADLLTAAENNAYKPADLKTLLDAREKDLVALGPQDKNFKTLVEGERKSVETNLNEVFAPLSDKITAAQKDPAKWPEVQTEITRQFEQLAKDSPDKGETAINRARETLKQFGPEDAQFTKALDASGHEILVARPAKAVQDAYRSGKYEFSGGDDNFKREAQQEDGARRGAKTLNDVTKGVTPETAILILQEANKPIDAFGGKVHLVDEIEKTIGKRSAIEAGAIPDHRLGGKNSNISEEIRLSLNLGNREMFGNLSEVMDRISTAPQGKAVVDGSAKSIADAVTATEAQTFKDWEDKLPDKVSDFTLEEKKMVGKEMGIPYPDLKTNYSETAGDPFRLAIADGKGPALTLSVISQLKNSGNTSQANGLLRAAINGTDQFKTNSQDVVGDFAKDNLVVASDWKDALPSDQLAKGLNDSISKHPDSKNKMDEQGTKIVRTLDALHNAEDDLKGLDGFDDYQKSVTGLQNDEKSSFAVSNSEGAWSEMGRLYVTSVEQPGKEPVPGTPTLYWSGRAIVGMGRTLSAYGDLGGTKLFQPPTGGNIDTASRISPQPTDPRLAQLASGYLAAPDAAKNPAMRQKAIEDIGKAFEGSKFDPRIGIATTSGFGRGVAGLQGSLYLLSANDNIGSDNPLYKAFGAWLYTGVAYEASQLTAGGVQSLIQNGKIPTGGFLDKASRFASVSGTPRWQWFGKYFDRIGGALMVGYTLDYAAKGQWANSAFAATTTVGTFLSFMKSPKAGLWGAGLAVVGVVGEFIYNSYRKSKAAAYYEKPTEQFLIQAGFKPETAKILANHDGEGNSVGPALTPLAKELGMTPQALADVLRKSEDPAKLRLFVDQVHGVQPNKEGVYPMTAPPRQDPIKMPDGGIIYPDGPPGKSRTVPELAEWVRQNLIPAS